jgi:hypothetical protein
VAGTGNGRLVQYIDAQKQVGHFGEMFKRTAAEKSYSTEKYFFQLSNLLTVQEIVQGKFLVT